MINKTPLMHHCLQKVTVVLVVLAVACGNDRDGPTAPQPPPTPAVIGPTTFAVVEGETAVGTLRATDPDTPAADLVWSMAGGADRGHFTLGAGGVLAFAGAKDYEAPDDAGGDGTYELTVQVSDGTDDATAAVRVSLSNRNEAPVADAGADQPDVEEGATVTLRGTGEDPDAGDALRYAWTQTDGAAVTLSAPSSAATTFAAPTGLAGDAVLTFTLRVTDAAGLYAEDAVTVTVVAGETGPAVIGPTTFAVVEGETAVGTYGPRTPTRRRRTWCGRWRAARTAAISRWARAACWHSRGPRTTRRRTTPGATAPTS